MNCYFVKSVYNTPAKKRKNLQYDTISYPNYYFWGKNILVFTQLWLLFVTILFVHCFDIKSNQAKHNTTTLDYICRWWCDHPNLLFGKVQIWSCEKIIQVLTALVVSSWSIDRESKSNQTSDMAWWGTKLRTSWTPRPSLQLEEGVHNKTLPTFLDGRLQ